MSATVVTGGITSIACNVSHNMKLHAIEEECDKAMAAYVRDRLQSTGRVPPPEQWRQDTITTLRERFIPRNWHSNGIDSEGALRYLVGDFDFDKVMVETQDPKNGGNMQAERWLGRCGCIAKYAVLEAAKNGFADVRIYFANHPKNYRAVCPLMMHYYPVIGQNDTSGVDARFFVLTSKTTGSNSFVPVREEEIDSFLQNDYEGGNISLCMQSQRTPIMPKRQAVMA